MKHCFTAATDDDIVMSCSVNKDTHLFTKRLEKAIQRLSNGLSSSKAGALIQVRRFGGRGKRWGPPGVHSPRGPQSVPAERVDAVWLGMDARTLLAWKGVAIDGGVGDLLALFRCISCKYRFDADPRFGESMGAIGRVYYYGQPELCLDVQQYDKNIYLRISEAQRCRIHSTLILPIFDGDNDRALAVVELSHHDKSVEFASIIQSFTEGLQEVSLRTADVRMDNWKLGLRKWPVDVCSVPLSSIEDTPLSKKYPHEQGISSDHMLGRAMQTGFGQVSAFLMNVGMDSLANEEHSVYGHISDANTVFQQQNTSHGKNNVLSTEVSQGLGTGLSRSISDSGSANTTQRPELPSNDSVSPDRAARVCQASMPIAQEADEDMHIDPAEDSEKSNAYDNDKKDDEDDGSEAKKKENRLGGGAGKKLTYRDLESHFGHGLKDAARRLGICPTTLKRACRRNGITRWPSRQISKLLKVWKQMGYKGEPPSWLLQNAISGNLRSENLAYILSAGLHVGLNPQRCDCVADPSAMKARRNHLSLCCGNLHGADADGTLLVDEDLTFKNLTHHGAFTAALHGTEEEGFVFQDEQGNGHSNHTWHAGQMADVVLNPAAFPCHSQSTAAIPVQAMHISRDIIPSTLAEGPISYDLERTRRGGSGMIPVISELNPPIDPEDVLIQQSYHLSLGFETTQHLFH